MQTQETSAADEIAGLLNVLAPADPDMQVTIVGAILETLRLLVIAVPGKREETLDCAFKLFVYLRQLPIEAANFSLLRTVKEKLLEKELAAMSNDSPAMRAHARLSALNIFMSLLEIEPTAATQEVLKSLVLEEAENFNVPQPVVTSRRVELNQPATVLRVFKPAAYTHSEEEPRLLLVQYKGELPGGGMGPNMWGLSYNDDALGISHVVLETGEYLPIPSHALTLAGVTTRADVPPYLLACAQLFMPLLLSKFGKISDTRSAVEKFQARFGVFTSPVYFHQTEARSVASLTDVIEAAKWQFSGTAPVGAAAEFPVSELADSRTRITVVAESAAIRPYIYANLTTTTAGRENVVMRLDRPREFSALGVYLFPLSEAAVALIVPPE